MSNISFSGLSSGIDSESIISKMVELEKLRAKALQKQVTDAKARKTVVNDLQSKLTAVSTKTKEMDTPSEVRQFSAKSSDDTAVSATVSGASAPASYTLSVSQLARAETSRSYAFADAGAGAVAAGSLGITVGADSEVQVAFDETDSLADIATRINESGARVHAFTMFDGASYRLVVTGKDTGVDNAIAFSEVGDQLGLAQGSAEVTTALDANFEINGVAVTHASNEIDDVVAGLDLTLRDTTAAVRIDVAQDEAAIKTSVQGLIDSFNEVAKVLTKQLSYGGTNKGQDTLFGDSTVRALQRELGSVMTTRFGTFDKSAAELGIRMDAVGNLSLDATKFSAALAAEPTAFEDFLGGETGLAKTLATVAERYGNTTDGLLESKDDGIDSLVKRMESTIEGMNIRADKRGDALRRQFTALEAKLATMQSQASYLSALFTAPS